MIDLRSSRFTDVMPENLASQLETQAFAYALGRQIDKLCTCADGIRIYAAVASMPENILDMLAVELRTPAYQQKFPIEVKRALVEETLTFYTRMGTPAACNQMIETIFGSGRIEEWFDYGGKPHHFRAYVGSGGQITPEDLTEFRRVIAQVKRLSSWMDEIITMTALEPARICTAALFYKTRSRTTLPLLEPELPGCSISLGAAMGRGRSRTTLPMLDVTPPEMRGSVRLGTHTGTYMRTCLPVLEDFTSIISMNCRAGLSAGFISRSKTKLPEWEEML